MNENQIIEITVQTLYLIIKVAAPMLIVSLIIGLIISLLQTITSIQEQTLTFVPKVLGIFTIIMLLGHWILSSAVEYTEELWGSFSLYIR